MGASVPAGERRRVGLVRALGALALALRRGHELAALLRRNLATDKGAVQASWAFPVVRNLKGYVQVFSGYGASLID